MTIIIKKETPAQVFSCEFFEIFNNTFLKENLRTRASRKHVIDIQPILIFQILKIASRSTRFRHKKK